MHHPKATFAIPRNEKCSKCSATCLSRMVSISLQIPMANYIFASCMFHLPGIQFWWLRNVSDDVDAGSATRLTLDADVAVWFGDGTTMGNRRGRCQDACFDLKMLQGIMKIFSGDHGWRNVRFVRSREKNQHIDMDSCSPTMSFPQPQDQP
jgi:hypothetical protein